MVQNIFNKRNLNENLNFKNTFYLEERDEMANKASQTIYGHGEVYQKNIVDADLKAQLAAKITQEKHIEKEKKVKQGFYQTAQNAAQLRQNQAHEEHEDKTKHVKEVKKYFKKIQNVVGVMVGKAPMESTENLVEVPDEDTEREIEAFNIQKNANDEETTLNNRANIRTLMFTRCAEHKEKKRAEKEAKDQIVAEEEARKARIEKQEEERIARYLDNKKLSQTWKIYDKEKLKQTVRNEIMKEVMKEEERKNFEKLVGDKKKATTTTVESPKTLSIKKSKKQKEAPARSTSPYFRKKKTPTKKKYAFSPENIQKLPKETQKDFNKRYGFTTMALPGQKELLNPVEQHKITKELQEMVVRQGLEKNGRLAL